MQTQKTRRTVKGAAAAARRMNARMDAAAAAAGSEAIEALREQLRETHSKATAITAKADAERRNLTAAEAQELDALLAAGDSLDGEIERRAKLEARAAALATPQPRRVDPAAAARNVEGEGSRRVPATPVDARGGFRNFGDFAQAVMRGSIRGGQVDDRLRPLAASLSTYSSEGLGADGGFAVPTEFRSTIMQAVQAEESLLGRTDQQQTSSNNWTVPTDETTPWQSSGGIQAYWEGEAAAHTQSKISLKEQTLKLHKLSCLVPVTEELLDDAPSLESYLLTKVPAKMNYKINDAIVAGNGVGMPLGILNSPALVTVSKESSQAADTLLAQNVFKMYSRMYGPWRSSAVWLINQDVEPQMFGMTVAVKNVAGTENVGGSVVYVPPNGISGSPFGSLMGRPVLPMESCKTVGDVGDILFFCPSQYVTVAKTSGFKSQWSIHFWFDQDVAAFKTTFRLGGQPWLQAAISRANGSNTLSSIVALEAR